MRYFLFSWLCYGLVMPHPCQSAFVVDPTPQKRKIFFASFTKNEIPVEEVDVLLPGRFSLVFRAMYLHPFPKNKRERQSLCGWIRNNGDDHGCVLIYYDAKKGAMKKVEQVAFPLSDVYQVSAKEENDFKVRLRLTVNTLTKSDFYSVPQDSKLQAYALDSFFDAIEGLSTKEQQENAIRALCAALAPNWWDNLKKAATISSVLLVSFSFMVLVFYVMANGFAIIDEDLEKKRQQEVDSDNPVTPTLSDVSDESDTPQREDREQSTDPLSV